ncbi:MAG: SpoIIE family protein phosphatase [Acidobacteriota bacterium]|nr:SpoIIE family protein phosphatase [Acidobacteriota bacterium]
MHEATGVSAVSETEGLRVLVGDDQADVLEALRLLLKGSGCRTMTVDSPQALLRAAQAESFDLILMDLNYARDTTSGQEGLDLLKRLHEERIQAPVIVMTAWGNIELAVEAMHRGACDFVQKPWDNARLLAAIGKQAREARERASAERLARSEIEIARNVQQRLFPRKSKELSTIQYAASCVPAREVSGDYYDFLDLGPGALGFVLADVSGKGMPAALLMANLQACFRSRFEQGGQPAPALLKSINKLFHESTRPEHYATLFYGEYDDATRELRYVNCGHLAPVLARADGSVERLDATATVLGLFAEWDCERRTVTVHPGDRLLVFSDGVAEAGLDDETGAEEFGEDRLIALAGSLDMGEMEQAVERILDAVREFHPGPPADDMTVMAVRGL